MDLNVKAFNIVRSLTGEKVENPRSENARKGGRSGGPARAHALTPERRKEIAYLANVARWKNKDQQQQRLIP